MPRFETKNSFRVLGAAAFVLLAGVIVSPRSAEAACGDYVHVGGRAPHAMAGHVTHVPSSANESNARASNDGSNVPGVPRCSGPFCSKGSLPPAAPAPSIKVTVERWACVDVVRNGRTLAFTQFMHELGDRPADGFGLSILRPPR